MSGDLQVRCLSADEMETPLAMAREEGWNPGIQDAVTFFPADPHGFLVGEIEGEPICTISAVRYESHFGFLGLYICAPEWRGKGYGLRIWKRAMNWLDGRIIGLDGAVELQDIYRRSGFEFAYNHVRFEGRSGGDPIDNPRIVPLSTVGWEAVESMDRQCFPARRTAFLRSWISQSQGIGLGFVDSDTLLGYACIRPCAVGYRIGPLFGQTEAVADTLFQQLVAHVPTGQPVILDIPKSNPAARDLVQRYGMQAVFETARMYTGPVPETRLDWVYGVTTYELG